MLSSVIMCSYVLSTRSCIRPFLASAEDKAKNAPESFTTVQKATGQGHGESYQYRIQASVLDCYRMRKPAYSVCPAKEKAITMEPLDAHCDQAVKNWEYAISLSPEEEPIRQPVP